MADSGSKGGQFTSKDSEHWNVSFKFLEVHQIGTVVQTMQARDVEA